MPPPHSASPGTEKVLAESECLGFSPRTACRSRGVFFSSPSTNIFPKSYSEYDCSLVSAAVFVFLFRISQEFPPLEAKTRIIGGTLKSITETFDTFLVTPFLSDDPSCRKVVTFLLNIVSSICLLPPEGLLLSQLDGRLAEAFGIMCASEPKELLHRYPEVGGAAVRALLESMPLNSLCRTSNLLNVDISICSNKADVIQSLLDAGEPMDDGECIRLQPQTGDTLTSYPLHFDFDLSVYLAWRLCD